MNGTTGALKPVTIGSLTCTPINPEFGAEVAGVDFSKPVPAAQIADMVAAQDRFGVTVYRATGLDDAGHVALSAQLGALERVPKLMGPLVPDRFDFPELFDVGNTDREGRILQQGTRRWWFNKANAQWHTDSSFNQHRSKYSLLLAHILPSAGGDTKFADVRHAFRDLPEERKVPLRSLVAKHDLWHSRRMAAPEEYKAVSAHESATKPPAFHKLVQTAPDGGETLFIASHASQIIGLPKEEGLRLIKELIEHCTQPQYVLSVKWKQAGDLVWWDNRQTMHTATPFSDQMEKRDMRRTTVFDDGPERFGVPEAGEATV